ncbi:DNA replication ATP-dependent helicase/nuclease DNA2 [Thelohanellus kitauei]|uniref:DNA replication ATP-dependent helicase/nuclease n=1 Tax=Thelohanellus kitauei TaxID=669202 RepID=A0A0C2J0V6_THEKT|nr:DNA replication ATP-dependent helicase/nuclease DNA2 [Thelohanellus kitauei]
MSAIQHCINSRDYALLWGLPGTGKTTTIAAILYILNKLDKKVLITSHTNAAVDNILLKLIQLNVPFLRIGKQQSVHPDIKAHTLENILSNQKEWTTDEFQQLMKKQVCRA